MVVFYDSEQYLDGAGGAPRSGDDVPSVVMHINDTIRFLNAIGGGKIVRLDDTKQMAYVETEDGFVIPTRSQKAIAKYPAS